MKSAPAANRRPTEGGEAVKWQPIGWVEGGYYDCEFET